MTRQSYIDQHNKVSDSRLLRLIKTIDYMLSNNYKLHAAIECCRIAYALNEHEVQALEHHYNQ